MKTSMLVYHVKRAGRYIISGLLFMVLFQSAAMAQISGLYTGDKVRIYAPDIYSETFRGTIYGINTAEIILDFEGVLHIFPLTSIERLDVSYGKKRRTGRGALIGLTSGAFLGTLISLTTYEECNSDEFMGCLFHFDKGESALLGAAAGGFIGLIAGTAIGSIIKTDVWVRLPLEISMNIQSVPAQELSLSQVPVVSLKFSLSEKR